MLRVPCCIAGLGVMLAAMPAQAQTSIPEGVEVKIGGIEKGNIGGAWKNLSGLTAHPTDPNVVFAVPDKAAEEPRILKIDVSNSPAKVLRSIKLWACPPDLDLEGVAAAREGGFWLVSEGAKGGEPPNWLLRVDKTGRCKLAFELPPAVAEELDKHKYGFEGVALEEEARSEFVYVAFQRPFEGDKSGSTLIAEFDPAEESWSFFAYPLKEIEGDERTGLSELLSLGSGRFVAIERDSKKGVEAKTKLITTFELPGEGARADPHLDLGEVPPVKDKQEVVDLIDVFKVAERYVREQIEGLAITRDNELLVLTDNEPKHTVLINLGDAAAWGINGSQGADASSDQ